LGEPHLVFWEQEVPLAGTKPRFIRSTANIGGVLMLLTIWTAGLALAIAITVAAEAFRPRLRSVGFQRE
jgi:hypothetical protein